MLRHQRDPAHPYQRMPARLLAMSRGRQPSDRLKLPRHRFWKVVRPALASSLSGVIDMGVVPGAGTGGGGGGSGRTGLGTGGPGAGAGTRVAGMQPGAGGLGDSSGLARPLGGYQVKPRYPESARRQGAEGTTRLKIHVSDKGMVEDVLVERSAGHQDLDLAAMEAVKRWRFDPARQGQRPVAVWVMLPVRFALK